MKTFFQLQVVNDFKFIFMNGLPDFKLEKLTEAEGEDVLSLVEDVLGKNETLKNQQSRITERYIAPSKGRILELMTDFFNLSEDEIQIVREVYRKSGELVFLTIKDPNDELLEYNYLIAGNHEGIGGSLDTSIFRVDLDSDGNVVFGKIIFEYRNGLWERIE